MSATPFTDLDLVAGPLYATIARLTQRTGALHAAKISGDDATTTIVDLAAQSTPATPVICDIGCGRGTTTLHLATDLTPARLIALDQSQALLNTVGTGWDAPECRGDGARGFPPPAHRAIPAPQRIQPRVARRTPVAGTRGTPISAGSLRSAARRHGRRTVDLPDC
jgi:hypothetical protein